MPKNRKQKSRKPHPVRLSSKQKPGNTKPNNGMVWPAPYPANLAIPLAMQFKLQSSEWWSPQRLLVNQMSQVNCLLRHASTTVPYYRAKFRDYQMVLDSTLTFDLFRQLPLLQRMDIQSAGTSLISKAIPAAHGAPFQVRSSGSTGRPIRVLGTAQTKMYVAALTMRGHLWHQRDGTQKNVDIRTAQTTATHSRSAVWMAIPDGGKSITLDINRPIDKLLEQLIVEDPVYLQTHPYTLNGLIENSLARGLRPKSLREARTFGEALEPHIRVAARQHWGIEVVDNYSALETGPLAYQCPKSENLHVQSESVLLEVLRDDGSPCQPGEVGRVVITSLHNFATPLIRYELGDYAEVGDACSCGRGLPVLTRILGRQRNFLVLPTGEKRFPEAWRTFSDIAPEIRQFQLIQKSLERIEINLVVTESLSADKEQQLMHYLTDKFKHEFVYDFVYPDDIPRAANGKFEEFKSEVV